MRDFPYTRRRMTRTADGMGGYTESGGVDVTIWGSVRIHQDRTEMIFMSANDVIAEDQIRLKDGGSAGDTDASDDAWYRVVGTPKFSGSLKKLAQLERLAKPIEV